MGLTALEIYKHLPKKNCNECGVPTCLAFAMQLASLKVSLEKCPYVSEQAKALLAASAAPPIKLVKVGSGENEIGLGDETVLHRHDKTFYHPTGMAALVTDSMSDEELMKKVDEANALNFERVGMRIKLDMVAVKSITEEASKFEHAVSEVTKHTKLPLILMCQKPEVIAGALKHSAANKPLLHCATESNLEAMAKLAKEHKCPLVVHAPDLEKMVSLTEKVKGQGVEDIVLDFGHKPAARMLEALTVIRRLAIKKNLRALGYPVLVVLENKEDEAMLGTIGIMKYASAVVFSDPAPWKIYPLLTLRQNIFTDPQKPIQVKPGVYDVGKPGPNSPLLFTTNFSLTFFTVQGDVEKSKVGAHLMVIDTEGLSVMTSFAAGKLTPELVAKNLDESGAKGKVSHTRLIIPGMVARMSGKLQELTGWHVIVGPRDSSGIPSFMKTLTPTV